MCRAERQKNTAMCETLFTEGLLSMPPCTFFTAKISTPA